MAVKTVEITETYKMPDLVSKVAKGVALLDEKVPGWDKKINLDELDLSEGEACVVGQLAIKSMLNGPLDGYDDGIKKLLPKVGPVRRGASWAPHPDEEKHGFVITSETAKEVTEWLKKQPPTHPWWPFIQGPSTGMDYDSHVAIRNLLYDYLTAIWIQVIKDRKRQARKQAEAKRAAKKATAPRR